MWIWNEMSYFRYVHGLNDWKKQLWMFMLPLLDDWMLDPMWSHWTLKELKIKIKKHDIVMEIWIVKLWLIEKTNVTARINFIAKSFYVGPGLGHDKKNKRKHGFNF